MRVRHVGLALGAFALAVSACSWALNWSQDGLPCEFNAALQEYSCLSGYTCALRDLNNPNDNLCIENYSLGADSNCQKDIQCAKGYTCPSGTCLPVCDPNTVYLTTSSCQTGQYCKPFYTTSGSISAGQPNVTLEGACVPSDQCTSGQACTPDQGTANSGLCMAINTSTSACVLHCNVTFNVQTSASGYVESCSTRGTYYSSCQAIGPSSNQTTSCVTEFPTALPEGSACNNPFSQPCQSGLTCWGGTCKHWCPVTDTPGAVCANTEYCCPTTLSNDSGEALGYCVSGGQANCLAN